MQKRPIARPVTLALSSARPTHFLIVLVLLLALVLSQWLASTATGETGPTRMGVLPSYICPQLIVDPSFEERNDSVWYRPITPYRARYVNTPVYDGSWAVQTGIPIGGPNKYAYSSVQ